MDKAIDSLKEANSIDPDGRYVELAKKKVFRGYYGATRHIYRDLSGGLHIDVDTEMVDILSGRKKT